MKNTVLYGSTKYFFIDLISDITEWRLRKSTCTSKSREFPSLGSLASPAIYSSHMCKKRHSVSVNWSFFIERLYNDCFSAFLFQTLSHFCFQTVFSTISIESATRTTCRPTRTSFGQGWRRPESRKLNFAWKDLAAGKFSPRETLKMFATLLQQWSACRLCFHLLDLTPRNVILESTAYARSCRIWNTGTKWPRYGWSDGVSGWRDCLASMNLKWL